MKILFVFLYVVTATIFNPNYIFADNSSYAKSKMQNGIQPESSPSPPHHTPIKDPYKFCNTPSSFDTSFHISFLGSVTFGPYWTGVCSPQSSNFLNPQIAAQHNLGVGYWLFGFTIHETITLDAMGECGIYWESGFARGCARYYSDPKAKCPNRAQVSDSDRPPPNSLNDYDWCNNSYICVFSDPIDVWGDLDPFNMPLPQNTPSPKSVITNDPNSILSMPYLNEVVKPAVGALIGIGSNVLEMILSKLSFIFKFLDLNKINHIVMSNIGCIPTPLAPFPPNYTTFAPIQTPNAQTIPICQKYYDGKVKIQQFSTAGSPCATGYAQYSTPTPVEQSNGDVFFSTYSLPAIRVYYDLPLLVTNASTPGSSTLTFCSESNNTNCIKNTQKNICGNVSSGSLNENYFAEYVPMNSTTNLFPTPYSTKVGNDSSFTNLYPNAYSTKIDNDNVTNYNILRVEQNTKNTTLSNAETFDVRASVSSNAVVLHDGISFSVNTPLHTTIKNYTFKYEESENNQFCILDDNVPPTYYGCIKRSPMPMPLIVGVNSSDLNIFPDNNNTYGIQFKNKEMKIIGPQDSADSASTSSLNFSNTDFTIENNNICSNIKNANNQQLGLYLAQGDDKKTMQSACINFYINQPYAVPYLNPIIGVQNSSSSSISIPNIQKSATTNIQGNQFSLYPTDAYNTPASLIGKAGSSNSSHQYLIGEYVDNKGNKVDFTNKTESAKAIAFIKANIDNYVNNATNQSTADYYYIGGLEYRDYTYIRGATKLCLSGYSNNDSVISPNLSHTQDSPYITHSNQQIINNWQGKSSNNISKKSGAASNVNDCNSNQTENVQRDSQYFCQSNQSLDSSCEFTYNGTYNSMDSASLYLPDRILPPFSTSNNQYIDSIASINSSLPTISPSSKEKQFFYSRKKTPQELGVCVDIPKPQCIVTTPTNNTPGTEIWNSGTYPLGAKVQGKEILKNSAGVDLLQGMCVGDPQNIGQTKIIKIGSGPECPGGAQMVTNYGVIWPEGNFQLGSVQLGCTDQGFTKVQGTCKLDKNNTQKAYFQDLITILHNSSHPVCNEFSSSP